MLRRKLMIGAGGLLLAGRARAQVPAGQVGAGLTVFAAASLTDVLKALGEQWRAKSGQAVTFSFAASSTLARQIEQGAPADVFASADAQWMDYLQQRHLIVDDTRVDAVSNSLVLVAPAGQATPVKLTRDTDLVALLGADGRIATGDPAHVPVGLYAKAALTWMGQWSAIEPRLARADDVRSALLLVERGEAPFGIVYGSDAAVAPGVKIVGVFPPESHPPVVYPFAVVRRTGAGAGAADFVGFVAGADARPVFGKFGFSPIERN